MEVTNELVAKMAHLARLQLDETSTEQFKHDLQNMIGFVEKLNELDTTGVAPLLHMSSHVNLLRQDVVGGSISRELALRNAPHADEDFFKVPKVIKK